MICCFCEYLDIENMISALLVFLTWYVFPFILLSYSFFKYKFRYWNLRNVTTVKPTFPFGNFKEILRSDVGKLMAKFYNEFKGKTEVLGLYCGFSPIALIVDIDLVKNVLIKDFNSFQNRGFYIDPKSDPLSVNLFNVEGEKWRNLRTKFSANFTSGKMKLMFPIMVDISERLVATLWSEIEAKKFINMKSLMERYSTDVIGCCAFGIECNTLENQNSEFAKMVQKTFKPYRIPSALKYPVMKILQKVLKVFNFSYHQFPKDVCNFFLDSVKQTVEFREKNGITRNDFMDLLIKMKNSDDEFSVEDVAAQAFIFFVAGFESSSQLISSFLHEMSNNQEIQERLRQEILDCVKRNSGKLKYEEIMELPYLGRVLNEVNRKYLAMGIIIREATTDYRIPGNPDTVIEKGTTVFIPTYAIHYDPDFYPEPQKFDPDRFLSEESSKRPSCSFLPFGEGPRNCVGYRFGIMETRIACALLLKAFRFKNCPKTQNPLGISYRDLLLTVPHGVWLSAEKI